MVLSMDRWVGKVAIVTGAASGMGAAIAQQLLEKGLTVAGLDINPEPIKERAKQVKGQLHAIKVDLCNEEEILEAFKWITENLGPVHILCNVAGYSKFSTVLDEDTEAWKRTLGTNVLGLSVATREAVKIMKANNINGHIVHINSVMGHKVVEYRYSVYPASKYAVTALTETLRLQLKAEGSKIKVTSVSPGLTETGLTTFSKNQNPEFRAMFEHRLKMQPEDVADAVLYVLSTPEHVQVHELTVAPIFQ